ncbi:uncharacterized protein LOC124431582 [Vespa crabro]|uniref:uncharacterized protein LOC124431582 n=1 Tax=Vespa crabro TaxID=7445 RepID=UPI001EFFB850|nr:uncharacterized protein LOC124431582 [Vespa crabro]
MSCLGKVISGRGRDTHATAVSGGDRAGHPPSSTNCQELGVGNLAPALVSASGRASQVGDLACGVSNMPGSSRPEEENLEEWQKVARAVYRVRLSGQRSPISFRRSKRAKPVTYSSEEEETGVDVVGWSTEVPTVAQLPQVETCRLLEIATRQIQMNDAERRKCGNIKGSISGKIKSSNSYVVKIHQTLLDRFQAGDGDPPSTQEAIVQLKAELRALELRKKEMAEELARLKKERAKEPRPVAARSESTTPEIQQLIEAIRLMTESFRFNQQHPQQPQQQQQQLRQQPQQQQQQQQQLRQQPQQQQQQHVARTLTPQGDFVQVLGRKERRAQRREANPLPRAALRKEGNDPQPLRGQVAPKKGKKKRSGAQRRKRNRQREREVAAVSLSCTEEMTYRDALGRAVNAVNLKDLGITNLPCKRGLTGAFIWKIRGKGANEKADRMAEAIRNTVPGAKITRPVRTSTIKLVGLDAWANRTIIRNALLEIKSGTDPNLIKIGEIRIGRGRLGETIVSAHVPITRAALDKGKLQIGISTVRVREIRQSPLRCHRCLARGHIAAMCSAEKSRTDVCYVCGKTGHIAKMCTDKASCPVCTDAGRKPTNHRAGSWECPVVPPRKWVDKVYAGAPDVCPEETRTQGDSNKIADKCGKKNGKATEKRQVHDEMEVE